MPSGLHRPAITPDAPVRLQRVLAGACGIALCPGLADADRTELHHKAQDVFHRAVPAVVSAMREALADPLLQPSGLATGR